jgi:tetratricopeptide (TPR) repeat protein
MDLKGNLETMPIPDILQWIADSNKTGTLKVTYKSETKKIFFRDGVIVSAASNLDKDRFGVLIVKEGFVAQEELLKLLEEGKQKGKMLGKLCVEKGIITEKEVKEMLQMQAEKIIESLFHREEGDFVLDENEKPNEEVVPISIVMHQLFFDSASKRLEWRRIHNVLGRMNTVLKPAPHPPRSLSSLSEFEQSIITICNGKNTLLDICAKVDRKDFDICITLAKLVEQKWLLSTEKPGEDTDKNLQDKLWQASILIEQKRYLQATQLLESERVNFPDQPDIDQLLKKSHTLLKTDIDVTFPSDDIKPHLVPEFNPKNLQSLNFSSREWFVYSQINGITSMKNLYRISGLGKEATRRIVYMLMKSGAVEVKTIGTSKKSSETGQYNISYGKKTSNADPDQSDHEKTGEYSIPDKYLRKPSGNLNADQAETEDRIPDRKELDQIYSKYLKLNNYQILKVSRNASQGKIRDAFVSLSKKYHPDMHTGTLQKPIQDRLEELFSLVNHAYSTLSNPISRKRYDEEIWANERFGEKDLDDLAAMIQTSKEMPVIKVDNNESPPKSRPVKTKVKKEKPEKTVKSPPRESAKKKETPKPEIKEEPKKMSKWETFFEEGLTRLKEKKWVPAVQAFENALKYNAKNSELYYRLSIAHYKKGTPDIVKAEENIKKALILDPENSSYFCQLSRIEKKKGNDQEAERYAKTALAWDSYNNEAKKLLATYRESSRTWFNKLKFGKKK